MTKLTALSKIVKYFFSSTNSNAQNEAEIMLNFVTNELKLKAPTLPEDHCQALMDVYIEPSFNMWEDDFNKDPKAVAALNKILSRKNKPLVEITQSVEPELEVKIDQIVKLFEKSDFTNMRKDLQSFLKTNSLGDFIYDAEHKMGMSHANILRLIRNASL